MGGVLWFVCLSYSIFYPPIRSNRRTYKQSRGWLGGAKVLVNFQCQGVLLVWITVEKRPVVLAVGAEGGCLDIFSLIYQLSFLSPSLWETARYRLKCCTKGPLSLTQPTNQPTNNPSIRPSPVCLSVHPSISINCLKPLRTF